MTMGEKKDRDKLLYFSQQSIYFSHYRPIHISHLLISSTYIVHKLLMWGVCFVDWTCNLVLLRRKKMFLLAVSAKSWPPYGWGVITSTVKVAHRLLTHHCKALVLFFLLSIFIILVSITELQYLCESPKVAHINLRLTTEWHQYI